MPTQETTDPQQLALETRLTLDLARTYPATTELLLVHIGAGYQVTQVFKYLLCDEHATEYATAEQDSTYPVAAVLLRLNSDFYFCQQCYSNALRDAARKPRMFALSQTPMSIQQRVKMHA